MVVPVIVDIFAEIVSNTNTEVIAQLQAFDSNIQQVSFQSGTPKEIISKLEEDSKGPNAEKMRYPLIAVFQPFDEKIGSQDGICDIPNLRIIIANRSRPEWRTPDRYTNNFKPILYPIYSKFIDQVFFDRRFLTINENQIPFTKRDWPFWDDGKDSNPFNDYLDIIELTNFNLKINLNNC